MRPDLGVASSLWPDLFVGALKYGGRFACPTARVWVAPASRRLFDASRGKPERARKIPGSKFVPHPRRAFDETLGGRLFSNPGDAGRPMFGAARSLAILHCQKNGIRPEFVAL